MDLPGGIDPWDQPGEAGGEHEPSDAALAFAAYHDAWLRRHDSGDGSTDDLARGSERVLVAALRARRVPPEAWASGTLLRETLWAAWAVDRGPRRMHLTIARYRVRRVLRAPRAFVDLFRDPVPTHLRIPEELARVSRVGAADEELTVPFTAATVFATRLESEWPGLDVDDGDPDEHPTAELPVWLDPVPGAPRCQASVMLGREPVGTTTLPPAQHAALVDATDRRGRRLVADGVLTIERTGRGRFRAPEVDLVHVPEV